MNPLRSILNTDILLSLDKGSRKIAPKAPVRRRPAATTTPASSQLPQTGEPIALEISDASQSLLPPSEAARQPRLPTPPPSSTSESQVPLLPSDEVRSLLETAASAPVHAPEESRVNTVDSSQTTTIVDRVPSLQISGPRLNQNETSDNLQKQSSTSHYGSNIDRLSKIVPQFLSNEEPTSGGAERPHKRRRVGSPLRAVAPITPITTASPEATAVLPSPEPSGLDVASSTVSPGAGGSIPSRNEETPLSTNLSTSEAEPNTVRRTRSSKKQKRAATRKETTEKKIAAVTTAVQAASERSLRRRAASAIGASATDEANQTPPVEQDVSGDGTAVRRMRTRGAARKEATTVVQPDAEAGALSTSTEIEDSANTADRPTIPGVAVLENGVVKAARARKIRSDKGKTRKKSTRTSEAQQSQSQDEHDDITNAADIDQKSHRRRAQTPDDSENIMIDTSTVIMNELIRDGRHGKLSQREKEMRQINWDDVHTRRKAAMWKDPKARQPDAEAETDAATTLDSSAQPNTDSATAATESTSGGAVDTRSRDLSSGPLPGGGEMITYIMRNGVITLNTDSTRADRRKRQEAQDREMEVVEEDDLERRLTSHTWRFSNARTAEDRIPAVRRGKRWNDDQTDKFYDAIRMFGTDFMIISKMFPGRTRRHIKAKFVAEEKSDPDRIKAALIKETVPIDFSHYLLESGLNADDFKDPDAIREELRLEQERMKKDIEEAKIKAAEDERQKKEAAELGKEQKKKRERKKKGQVAVGGEEVEVVEEDLE